MMHYVGNYISVRRALKVRQRTDSVQDTCKLEIVTMFVIILYLLRVIFNIFRQKIMHLEVRAIWMPQLKATDNISIEQSLHWCSSKGTIENNMATKYIYKFMSSLNRTPQSSLDVPWLQIWTKIMLLCGYQ